MSTVLPPMCPVSASMCPVFTRMCPLFGQMCPVCVRMCPVGVDDAFGPAAPARRFMGGFGVAIRRGLSPQAVGDGFGVGRRREGKGCSRCWRRSVQFLPECVHFSGQCVQFSPHSAPMCSLFEAMCSVGVDGASARAAPARRFGGGFGVEIRRGLRAEAVGNCLPADHGAALNASRPH